MPNEEKAQKAPQAKKGDIAQALKDVMKKGSNKELALIADNPDGTAEVFVCRGDNGIPEAFWFHLDEKIMDPQLVSIIAPVLRLDAAALARGEGIYPYMATVAGVAACFQTDIPGAKVRMASVGPLDTSLYQFVEETRGWSEHEIVFIKRNRNLAYRYRKLVTPHQPARSASPAPEDEMFEELPSSAYEVSADELEAIFGNEE